MPAQVCEPPSLHVQLDLSQERSYLVTGTTKKIFPEWKWPAAVFHFYLFNIWCIKCSEAKCCLVFCLMFFGLHYDNFPLPRSGDSYEQVRPNSRVTLLVIHWNKELRLFNVLKIQCEDTVVFLLQIAEFCGWSFRQFTGFAIYLLDIFITILLNRS